MQVEAKDIDQGQLAFIRFQYEISKWCGSFGHEIMVRKQLWPNIAYLQRQTFSKITRLTKILDNNPVPVLLGAG